jgi:hypothetical protein
VAQTGSGVLAVWQMDGTYVEAADCTRIGSTACARRVPIGTSTNTNGIFSERDGRRLDRRVMTIAR